jgi:hypothetical protein
LEPKYKSVSRLVFYIFLFLFIGTAIFARWNVIETPIIQYRYNMYIKPHLESSTSEIILSKHHRQIQIYKNAFSNLLYKKFGVNEFTFRAFSLSISFLTIVSIFLFTKRAIGVVEALIALLLFGVSYYSIFTVKVPYYGAFNMFGSFLSFYFLFKGLEGNKHIHWFLLGVISFLSITNVIIAGITLPSLFIVAVIYLYRKRKLQVFSISELKSRSYRFLIYLSVSSIAALILYQLRGLDLVGSVLDIIVNHEVDPKVNADNLEMEKTFYSGFFRLLYTVFVTFNFEHGDGSDLILGNPEGPWVYCFLFIVGLWSLYKSHRDWFWSFMGIFLTPIIISGMILRISEARFLALIHPFYLITVAIGFVYLFQWLKKFQTSDLVRDSIVLLFAYIVFVGVVHPKPLWATPVYDQLFETKGIREFRDYLKTNLKDNDIILNVTSLTELRGEIGDALNLSSYNFYLEEFRENHRLELLPIRNGRVGVWLILRKPLASEKLVPFYFPVTYSPKVVMQVKKHYLYYGEIDIPKTKNIENDIQFTTPFWSYMKGYVLQKNNRLKIAKSYYELAEKYGYNLERIYYNLALVNIVANPYKSYNYMERVIEIIQTPTSPSDKNQVNSWQTYGHDKKGLPDLNQKGSKLRFIYAKKNGIKYKKWFMEDLIKANPNYFALYYFNSMLYARLLYTNTGDKIYLKKINDHYKIGSKLAKGTLLGYMEDYYIEPKTIFYYLPHLSLLGISELYPPIMRN